MSRAIAGLEDASISEHIAELPSNLSNASAAGRAAGCMSTSGWWEVRPDPTKRCQILCQRNCQRAAARVSELTDARLIAFDKPGGGVRPIGEVWHRLASLCALAAPPKLGES